MTPPREWSPKAAETRRVHRCSIATNAERLRGDHAEPITSSAKPSPSRVSPKATLLGRDLVGLSQARSIEDAFAGVPSPHLRPRAQLLIQRPIKMHSCCSPCVRRPSGQTSRARWLRRSEPVIRTRTSAKKGSYLGAKDMIERTHRATVQLICPMHVAAVRYDDRPLPIRDRCHRHRSQRRSG